MEQNPSRIQIEIIEFIAQFVRSRMMRGPEPFYDVSHPVFDHECTSAYEGTAEILSNAGLMKTFDERPNGFHVFTCEPESFNGTIRSNAQHIPSGQDCLKWLISFAEQSSEISQEPFLSFLKKQGIIDFVEAAEAPDLEPIVEAVLDAMCIENNDANRERLTALMRAEAAERPPAQAYEFTEKGKQLQEILFLENQGLEYRKTL